MQLTIYKGRPGGLLWFQPTLVERTNVTTSAVLPSRISDLQRGQQEATVADARRYVDNLKAEGQAHGIGSDHDHLGGADDHDHPDGRGRGRRLGPGPTTTVPTTAVAATTTAAP